MSTVSAAGCASPLRSGTADAAQPTPMVASASLMPDPDMTALAGHDALSLMYFFEAKDQSLSVDGGTARIQGLQAERNRSFVQERQAIAKEDDAAKQGGFWGDMGHILGDVAKVAGIVAAVAVTVCTAGTAAPVAALAIAGILLSSASFVDGEFHVLQKLGVDPKAAGWVDTGMAVVGAVCSFGAGAASAQGERPPVRRVLSGGGPVSLRAWPRWRKGRPRLRWVRLSPRVTRHRQTRFRRKRSPQTPCASCKSSSPRPRARTMPRSKSCPPSQ
jgi:hypothetical protein